MLSVEIDEVNGLAILEPDGPLTKGDFESAAKVIDPYIENTDQFNGIIIHTESFPGWDSFAALASHLRFVKEHHKKISRVAISTNSVIGNFSEAVASHFVNAEIKLFSYQELEQAKDWIISRG
ncbi:MAG: STAS/SEC14 domain-containing protein [Gammaproteobacteria bacterium]|nr:STAS/SEC14 domain-containing protein [Pseudomonadota bacterium]